MKKKVKVSGKKKGANAGTTPAKQTATTGTAQRVLRTTGLAGTAPAPHPTNAPNVMTTDLPYLDMQYVLVLTAFWLFIFIFVTQCFTRSFSSVAATRQRLRTHRRTYLALRLHSLETCGNPARVVRRFAMWHARLPLFKQAHSRAKVCKRCGYPSTRLQAVGIFLVHRRKLLII